MSVFSPPAFRALILAGVMSGMAACAPLAELNPFAKEGPPRPAPAKGTAKAPAAPAPVRPKAQAPAKAKATPAAPVKEAERKPGSAEAPPTPTAGAPALVGLTDQQTASLLGAPSYERLASPSRVWQYVASGCILEVHLFPDVERGGFHALDYTASGPEKVTPDQCLDRVLQKRAAGS